MLFNVLLYVSLGIFILGAAWRISAWFRRRIGVEAGSVTGAQRVAAALKGIIGTIFSGRILDVLKVFVLDVLIQRRILRQDVLRWVMHMSIFVGFMLLLLMHALDNFITVKLFSEYNATNNPFFFLRDLAGVLVIVGLVIAVYRRFFLKIPRLSTSGADLFAIAIIAVIILSGIFLLGAKVISHGEFMRMVEDYSDSQEPEEVAALEAYWVKEYGLASPTADLPFDEETLAQGEEINEMSCVWCHAKSEWAFASYGVSRVMKPAAAALEGVGAVYALWFVHILACFVGLAYLPFSKMFHVISTPVGLMVNAAEEGRAADPVNVLTRRAIELDACTSCHTCSLMCSQAPAFAVFDNPYILPSRRMAALRKMGVGGEIDPQERKALRQGAYICSNCDRCTVVCPAGINLRELWISVREELVRQGDPEPAMLSQFSFVRGLNRAALGSNGDYAAPLAMARKAVSCAGEEALTEERVLDLNDVPDPRGNPRFEREAFLNCFGCRNCTTVCPVVGSFENPQEKLGLLPHQIMCSLGLGLTDLACSAQMLWECSTCYQCQEHCPQGVSVSDLLYDLKNLAVQNRNE